MKKSIVFLTVLAMTIYFSGCSGTEKKTASTSVTADVDAYWKPEIQERSEAQIIEETCALMIQR